MRRAAAVEVLSSSQGVVVGATAAGAGALGARELPEPDAPDEPAGGSFRFAGAMTDDKRRRSKCMTPLPVFRVK